MIRKIIISSLRSWEFAVYFASYLIFRFSSRYSDNLGNALAVTLLVASFLALNVSSVCLLNLQVSTLLQSQKSLAVTVKALILASIKAGIAALIIVCVSIYFCWDDLPRNEHIFRSIITGEDPSTLKIRLLIILSLFTFSGATAYVSTIACYRGDARDLTKNFARVLKSQTFRFLTSLVIVGLLSITQLLILQVDFAMRTFVLSTILVIEVFLIAIIIPAVLLELYRRTGLINNSK